MNSFPSREIVERVRREFPPGTRVKLLRMNDQYNSTLKPGAIGEVIFVDDCATIHVSWSCGSSLGVVYGEDLCVKV